MRLAGHQMYEVTSLALRSINVRFVPKADEAVPTRMDVLDAFTRQPPCERDREKAGQLQTFSPTALAKACRIARANRRELD